MKTSVKLRDLVMLQMLGQIEGYISGLSTNQDLEELIEDTRAQATTPDLFGRVIDRTVNSQFGYSNAVIRELGQNAIDSYPEGAVKKVEITTKEKNGTTQLAVRDLGKGMSPAEVVKNLLIPYNSGKDLDISKIGEHGIGWYSVMDLADKVRVFTGNGRKTFTQVERIENDWTAHIETQEGNMRGTNVVAYMPCCRADERELREGASKFMGLISPDDALVTFNGEQVNTLSQSYKPGAETNIHNKGKDQALRLNYTTNQPPEPFSDRMVFTQKGLYVLEKSSMFDDETIHSDLFDCVRNAGVSFWVDLPTNVGLTKGRNGVVGRDQRVIADALHQSFENYFLNVVLDDDELTEKIDHQMSDIVQKILEAEYKESSDQNSENTKIHGKDYGGKIFAGKKSGSELQMKEQARNYLDNVRGFSRELISKPFIPTEIVVGEDRQRRFSSIEHLVGAYSRDELFNLSPNRTNSDGIYVLKMHELVGGLVRHLDSLAPPKEIEIVGCYRELPETPRFKIAHTPLKVFRKISENKGGIGTEYQAFLDISNYLDGVVSSANRMWKTDVMLYFDEKDDAIARANKLRIAFNLDSPVVNDYLNAIGSRELTESESMSLVDVLIHEKTHVATKQYDEHATHGVSFYRTKRTLRQKFLNHCQRKGIDVRREVNQRLGDYTFVNRINTEALGELIAKYS